MENERESANNLACTAEIHRWNSSADKNYDTRFRLNAQCASAVKGMDFSKRLFFFVGYNPACFYEMPLMHFESIAQSLKEATGMLHEFRVIILANAETYFGRQTEHFPCDITIMWTYIIEKKMNLI